MANVKSEALPPEMVASLRQIGMDRVVTIVRSGNRPAWVLYPHLKASVEIPSPGTAALTGPDNDAIKETKLGTENVGGRLCNKYRFVSRTGSSDPHEALVWRAPDLRQFPVQIQMDQEEATMVVRYSGVRLAKPSSRLFTLPPNYKKYESMEKVMQEALRRLLPQNK